MRLSISLPTCSGPNFRLFFSTKKECAALALAQINDMNCQTNKSSERSSGSGPVAVPLIAAAETAAFPNCEGNSVVQELPLEQAMHRRAEAMTDVLTKIMDRPAAQRFWGLNE